MNKPKELTGVVKTYIDWKSDEISRFLSLENMPEYRSPYDEFCRKYIQRDLNIYKFLIQPFTPDLLQLFEGWGKEKRLTGVDYSNSELTAGYNSKNKILVIYNIDDYRWEINTLNDFITLCNRARVNLKWREE